MDLERKKLRRYFLYGASALAITAFNPAVMAQDADQEGESEEEVLTEDETMEEIVVTGYRRSLATAQSQKENADTFLDAITAEDIGALPDRSVAEALQRVPGVNISRFREADDPDRFSVEGSGVVVRGLPFVRSELNGRGVFSANGGRTLSFNDISPELLGGIQVFKNATADMIDGGISGTVNLITRKPLDSPGFRVAGTLEANYGDLADEVAPAFSILASNTWETDAGTFGLQLGYAQSELITRTDASQVTDPCYRDQGLADRCLRVIDVGDAGFGDNQNFTEANFPPEGTVVVPKGAGVRTTEFDRDRNAISAIGQWESPDRSFLVTAEYLRAEADLQFEEFAVLALVNDDNLFPIEGTPFQFDDNGIFQSGLLSQVSPRGQDDCLPGSLDSPEGLTRPCNPQIGIPTELLRYQREDDSVTEDFSLDIDWNPTERLSLNFEAQHVDSGRQEDGLIGVMSTYSDIFLDVSGGTPDVEFRTPATTDGSSDPNYFSNPDRSYYWFIIDNQLRNEGELTSFRADADYDLGEGDNFFKAVRFGARWADRNRVTRNANFSNWGNLSAPWLGSAVYASNPDVPQAAQVRDPFSSFQRGNVSTPIPDGAGFFFGGEDLVSDYLNGTIEEQADIIASTWGWGGSNPSIVDIGTSWSPIDTRGGLVEGTPFLPGEISDVDEETLAFYGRVDFGTDDLGDTGWILEGNIGLRYVDTTIKTGGEIQFPPAPPPNLDVFCDPSTVAPGAQLPGFCLLSAERQQEFLNAFTGELINDDANIGFDNWLPSLNLKLEVEPGVLFRFAVSKGISRPDLADFRTGATLFDNTNNLRAEGTLETGPLFAAFTGNRLLRPVRSWNYDLSFEYYFDEVGQITVSAFLKDLNGLVNFGQTEREFTAESGNTVRAQINGPTNEDNATIKGFEVAYQQTFTFLPSPFDGFGVQATYTYVDAGSITNDSLGAAQGAFADGLPLVNISENTINFTGFYEKDRISARLAYNWRDEFVITPRDVIFPFSPIIGEATGQLDGSFFYAITDGIKVGVQAVNLLDEVTKTSQIIDFDGTQVPRSAFRNDRRFSLLARFDF